MDRSTCFGFGAVSGNPKRVLDKEALKMDMGASNNQAPVLANPIIRIIVC